MTINANICIFLQVRLDSTRLPRKALLDLQGRTVIEHAMNALRGVPAQHYVMVTDKDSAPDLSPLAKDCGFSVFVGPKEDVLLRYAMAAEAFEADIVVRATGDNPLVSAELASLLIRQCAPIGPDYAGFLGMPAGLGVELLSRKALDTASALALDPYEREHVSPYVIRRPNKFRVLRPLAPDSLRFDARVTLDTPEDYERLKIIFAELYCGRPIEAGCLVEWLKEARGARRPSTCCV